MAVPSAPHPPSFAFFDVYRIPDTPFGVIVLMDFLNRHRTSFRLTLTFALNLRANKFAVCSSALGVSHSGFAAGCLGGCGLEVTRLVGTIQVCEHSRVGHIRPMGLMGRSQKPDTKGPSAKRRTPNAKRRTPNVHL